MSRFRVRAGSAALVVLFLVALLAEAPPAVRAQQVVPTVPAFWFAGTRLIFSHADRVDDEIAVRGSDPGLARFLARVGATLSWAPGSRYVVITTSDRRTLTFTLGVPSFQTSAGNEEIPLHAYIDGNDVYLPFLTLARALYVKPILRGGEYILQPQIGALDARAEGRKTVVTLHGAMQLRFSKIVDTPERLTLLFSGTASTLEPSRSMELPGLGRVDVSVVGDPRNPSTSVTFEVPAGSGRTLLPSPNPNELAIAFAPKDVALGGSPVTSAPQIVAAAPPTFAPAAPIATPAPLMTPATDAFAASPLPASPSPLAQVSPGPAVVSGLDVQNPAPDALLIHISTSPGLSYEWHRLGVDRFYIDFAGAALTFAPRDDRPTVPFVQSYRINQLQTAPSLAPTVRFALTTTPNRRIDVVPDATGVAITIADVDAGQDFVAQVGTGQTGGDTVAVVATAVPTLFATPPPGAVPPPGANPRLIVIDPGHGGSDTGAVHNGLMEKTLTLDIALRLRALLVARGWTVQMTRETDRDVYGPNASDVDELQARVDVADNAGARLFVSIHANASVSSVPNGTTTYWYKPEDRPLAEDIQHRLIAQLGTKDDGIVRERLYVVRRTSMPACLVETAFVSNPDDAAKLATPAFRQQIALGIADGIKDYAGQPASALSQQQ